MYDIEILDAQEHGPNGLITVRVCAVVKKANNIIHGPQKSYAIDPDTLAAHYGGQLNEWLAWVKLEHQKYHGLYDSMAGELQNLKGTKL